MLIENRKIRKILKNLGTEEIRKVPIRKKGFTGRMPKGNCHSNVSYLVCKYGGRQVTGYVVDKFSNPILSKDCTNLAHHSVWETPEGKLVDVTLNWCCPDDDNIVFAVVDAGKKGKCIKFPRLNLITWFDLSTGTDKWLVGDGKDDMVILLATGTQLFSSVKSVLKFIKSTRNRPHSTVKLSNVDKIDEIENARIVA